LLTTVALHVATGQLAGYTELDVPAESDRPVEQVDTLVLKDHRGHRIGMLLKLTNLRELATRFPDHSFVESMNARGQPPHARRERSRWFSAGLLRSQVEEEHRMSDEFTFMVI